MLVANTNDNIDTIDWQIQYVKENTTLRLHFGAHWSFEILAVTV